MPILDEILGFFRKPRTVGSNVPTAHAELVRLSESPTRIVVVIDLARIHDKRHMGPPGYFGYTWEENAGIGIMNNLVAAGIPMDWRHYISWAGDRLHAGAYRPTRGRLLFEQDPDFTIRSRVRVTWLDA